MDSIFQAGLRAIQNGFTSAADSAERVSRSFQPESNEDPVGPLIDLKQSATEVSAGAKIIQTGARLIGNLLDILA